MKYKCLKLSYKFPDFKSHIHKPKIFHEKIKRRLLSYETPVKKNKKDFSNVSILNFTPSPQKEIRNSFFYENSKNLSLNKMPQKSLINKSHSLNYIKCNIDYLKNSKLCNGYNKKQDYFFPPKEACPINIKKKLKLLNPKLFQPLSPIKNIFIRNALRNNILGKPKLSIQNIF